MGSNKNNIGLSKTREYISWAKMRERVSKTDGWKSKYYRKKGITVCDRWNGVDGFKNFIEDVGYAPVKNYSLDRINNDGNYEPGNVRWATHVEQCRNRSSNVILTYNGKSQTATEWGMEMKCPPKIILQRKKRGWSDEKCLTTFFKKKERLIEFEGAIKNFSEWAIEKGIGRSTLQIRLDVCKWSIEKALTTPVKTPNRK